MKGNHQEIKEYCEKNEIEVLLADGFEEALIGISESSPGREYLAIYDIEKCVEILMNRDKMSRVEAWEFLEFNTVGAWVGDKTPLYV